MITPRVVKGGIVEINVSTGRPTRIIPLQYNPESVTRTLAVQAAGATSGDHSQALRLKGVAVETMRVEVVLDATDRLEHPDQNQDTVSYGIHPQLAALEVLVQPQSGALVANDAMASAGLLEILPIEVPLTLFVWSAQRVVPVRITEMSITEEAFDAALNPILAKVNLTLRVLSVDDLGFDHRGGTLFMGYLRNKESLSQRAGSGDLATLGLQGIGNA